MVEPERYSPTEQKGVIYVCHLCLIAGISPKKEEVKFCSLQFLTFINGDFVD